MAGIIKASINLNNIDKTDSLYVCVKLKDSDKLIGCVKFIINHNNKIYQHVGYLFYYN